ncbi:aminomethyl-transferring glycine dehydrogenase subunit GcvPB [candidate division KSB1 bacterium]|nr:aminomethyl-transferring glycine dehydrogenase subunit GcvPB [candidate division KSB1 bacterium]
MSEPLLFEISSEGRKGYSLPPMDVPEKPLSDLLPETAVRSKIAELPELSEMEVIRHFTHLSTLNHHVDKGFYPLGSCTMKYNPKINDQLAELPGFSGVHPFQEVCDIEGALQLMGDLACYLAEISGMDEVTLQPAAGAHGEMSGIKIMRAYHEKNGNPRKKIILPDSAHGTNPASAAISGYEAVQIKSTDAGLVDLEDLKAHLDEEVAGFMLTNPNTLGLFEPQVCEIAKLIHSVDALLYMDGANLNALLGLTRPGDMGFDIVHINLHKTFSTPHGGGGPGSGPVGVTSRLAPFLPMPVINCGKSSYSLDWNRPDSIGKIHSFYGNFGVMVRAYVYIRMLGAKGLLRVSEDAILNANYMMRKLEKYFLLPHTQHHMHEFVLSGDWQKEKGVKTLDIAKRLLDYGVHAPTVYFPLIVHEALMIEPTETESKETLDEFIEIMIHIAEEVESNPEIVQNAPQTTPVRRLDEAAAARSLDVQYRES